MFTDVKTHPMNKFQLIQNISKPNNSHQEQNEKMLKILIYTREGIIFDILLN